MALKYSNNASTTVSTTVSAGTTIVVDSTATFPTLASGDWTYITINDEVLKVTSKSSNAFTLDTAMSSTFTDGDDVELRISKELLDDLSDQSDNYASWTISDSANGEAISSAELVTFVGGTNTTTTWNSTNNTLTITSDDTTYTSSDFNHDDLTGFVANEHIDWTTDQGATNVHAGNYTDTNTTYSVGDGGLTEKNFTSGLKDKLDGIEESAKDDQVSSDFTHNDLTGVDSDEHLDWTTAQSGKVIHASNYTDTDTDTKWDGGSSTLIASTGRTSLGLGNSATKNTGTASGTVCTGDDARLSDARTPVSHSHGVADLPAIAMTTVQTASTQVAQLALTAQEGDVVIRSDENKTYIHNGGTADTMADYTVLATPTDAVTSVNGNTGVVSLTIPTNNNQLTNGAGYITSYTDTNTVDMGDGFKVADSGGTDKFVVTENEKLRIAGTGGTTITFNASTQTVTIDSTDNDTVYNHGTDHPATAGNKHIPTGGSTGKFLKWSASGTAVWADDNNTVYSHPTHAGDDINIDTAPLTGATVISDLDFNVTTDTKGHVTDANGTVSTRTITLADLGYTGATNANNYSHPSHPGDDFSIDTGHLSGAVVIDDIDINVHTDAQGHVTDCNGTVATRTLTLGDLGYTGATNANNITNNNQLTNGAGYVTTDTNTHRGIDDTPVNGQTAESISSNWAYDHNAGTGNGKHIPSGGVTGSHIADNAISDTELAGGAVWETHLNVNAPTNDQVLTADSSATSGMKWADAGGGGVTFNTGSLAFSAGSSARRGNLVAKCLTPALRYTGRACYSSATSETHVWGSQFAGFGFSYGGSSYTSVAPSVGYIPRIYIPNTSFTYYNARVTVFYYYLS